MKTRELILLSIIVIMAGGFYSHYLDMKAKGQI